MTIEKMREEFEKLPFMAGWISRAKENEGFEKLMKFFCAALESERREAVKMLLSEAMRIVNGYIIRNNEPTSGQFRLLEKELAALEKRGKK